MNTLIIPDIHHNIRAADKAIKEIEHDRVLFLGDYFDDYNDTEVDAKYTARWLKRRIENHPEDIFLYGNHDLSYAFPCRETYCPGWREEKQHTVDDNLRRIHWDALKFFHREANWLFTHAGLTKALFKGWEAKELGTFVKESEELAQWMTRRSQRCWVTTGNFSSDTFDGPLWCRPNSSFIPIPGVNQVFGHTELREPLVINTSSKNVCLDTRLEYVGKFDGTDLAVLYLG